MGHGASKSIEKYSSEHVKTFQNSYDRVHDLSDDRFGSVTIYRNKTYGNLVMVSHRQFGSKEESESFSQEIAVRANYAHKNILQNIGYSDTQGEGFCHSGNQSTLYTEFHEHNLQKELERRIANQEFFTEAELWYLAEAIVSAGQFLEEHGIYHGDLRASQVILTSEGFSKIADHGLINQVKTNYLKRLSGDKKVYLSPELVDAYARRETAPVYNVVLSDVYSLGMTLLFAATLQDPLAKYYDVANNKVNHQVIDDALNRVATQYSQFLADYLRKMLMENPQKRPSFRDLYVQLAPYQENIRSMRTFTGLPQQQQFVQQSNVMSPTRLVGQQQPLGQSVLSPTRIVTGQPQFQNQSYVIPQQQFVQQQQFPSQISQQQVFNQSPTKLTTSSNQLHQSQANQGQKF